MKSVSKPLTKRPAWKALATHYKEIRDCICATCSRTIRSAASA